MVSTQTHHQTRYVPTGWCVHGYRPCPGFRAGDRGSDPCPAAAHHYCPHGIDSQQLTKDGESRCPYCRGAKRSRITP